MYKPGRGSSRGGGRRPSSTPPNGRGRGRGIPGAGSGALPGAAVPPRGGRASAAGLSAIAKDESFRLESGSSPVDFAAIIRLVPGLVEEIRRCEDAGQTGARIKFDANMNNSAENVIEVGGKEYRFTWASERGDLCNIYEEHQHGDDGKGLLVECGAAWRKVNVQRILDESAKNHVKMRSEEAERQSKSRKSIVLDPANPSVKSQANSMAAASVEGSMRRLGWKQKKEHFYNKKKADHMHASVVAPAKIISKTVRTPKASSKTGCLNSPLLTPEQSTPKVAAFPPGTEVEKISDVINEVIASFDTNKGNANKMEKDIVSTNSQVVQQSKGMLEKANDDIGALQSLLVSTLSENPKGMSFKALERIVRDLMPNSVKKIEAVIKNIATFQAPGRYFLKPECFGESSQRHTSDYENERSPGDASYEACDNKSHKTLNDLAQEEKNLNVGEMGCTEKIDVNGALNISGDNSGASNDSDGKASSSSESDSDSDSGSGSGSDNSSTSRSQAGSGSASVSDSDTDGSSSEKEGSDVVVDIMSDDDKPALGLKPYVDSSTVHLSPREGGMAEVGFVQDTLVRDPGTKLSSPLIDLNKFDNGNEDSAQAIKTNDSFRDNTDKFEILKGGSRKGFKMEAKASLSAMGMQDLVDHEETLNYQQPGNPETLVKNSTHQSAKQHINEQNSAMNDSVKKNMSKVSEKLSKVKVKRSSGSDLSKAEKVRMPKDNFIADDLQAGMVKAVSHRNSQNIPSAVPQDDWLAADAQKSNQIDLNANYNSPVITDVRVASGLSQNASGLGLHAEQSIRKSEKYSSTRKTTDGLQKHHNFEVNFDKMTGEDDLDDLTRRKRSRHNEPVMQDGSMHKHTREANRNTKSQGLSEHPNGFTGPDKLLSSSSDRNAHSQSMQKAYDKKIDGGKEILRREPSDLELGELREPPTSSEAGRTGRKFDSIGSVKSVHTKVTSLDDSSVDMNLTNSSNALLAQNCSPGRVSSADNHVNHDGVHKRGQLSHPITSKLQNNVPQTREILHRKDHESVPSVHTNRSAEAADKIEGGTMTGPSLHIPDSSDNNGVPLSNNGSKHSRQSKTQRNIMAGSSDEQSKKSYTGANGTSARKRTHSLSDETNNMYVKYDKDGPELRGPIKDISQFEEYVREFNEKYETYVYLNKELETVRNNFLKVESEFELAKGKDLEQYKRIGEKIKDMFHQSKERHQSMKRVFLLLHEELKVIKHRLEDFAEQYAKQ